MQLTIDVPDFKFVINDIIRIQHQRIAADLTDVTVIGFELGAGYTDLPCEEALTPNIAHYVIAIYPATTTKGDPVVFAEAAMTTLDKIQLETYGVKVGIRRCWGVNGEPAWICIRRVERE